jgi:hypothetical protein
MSSQVIGYIEIDSADPETVSRLPGATAKSHRWGRFFACGHRGPSAGEKKHHRGGKPKSARVVADCNQLQTDLAAEFAHLLRRFGKS